MTPAQYQELMALSQKLRRMPLTNGPDAPAVRSDGEYYPLISKRLTADQRKELLELSRELRNNPLTT